MAIGHEASVPEICTHLVPVIGNEAAGSVHGMQAALEPTAVLSGSLADAPACVFHIRFCARNGTCLVNGGNCCQWCVVGPGRRSKAECWRGRSNYMHVLYM